MRARVIINPSSGRQTLQRKAERLTETLLADGTFSDVDVVRTVGLRDAYIAARYYQDWQFDLILVVGGDGTVNEVVSGLLDGKHQTPLAILAAGTVNDFAYAMKLPRTDSAVARMIRQGKTRLIDVGQANDRYFVNVAAGGLLTDVAYKVPSEAKTVLGTLAYVIEGAKDLSSQALRPIPVHIETPERVIDEEILLFIVSNTSSVGGFRNLAPEASVTDGLLDVVLVKPQNILELFPLLVQMVNGVHVNHPKIDYFQTDSLIIAAPKSDSFSIDLDGEWGGELPVELKVRHQALRLIVP